MKRMLVIGGGLVGTVLSIFLAKKGYKVEVYDRMPDIRDRVVRSGKSVNITLCDRGFKTLDSIGVGDMVRRISVPARGRLMHDVHGGLSFQPYGNNNEAIYSISRTDLYKTLLAFADENFDIDFYFNEKCTNIDLASATVEMKNQVTGEVTVKQADRIFGADGAYSAVRMALQKTRTYNYSQQYSEHGYKELHVPAEVVNHWTREKNALHFWPRGNYVLIGFPNADGSFTCSLYMPYEGDISFEAIQTEGDLLAFFKSSFPDAIDCMPNLLDDFFTNSPNSLITIKCSPWHYKDKVLLIGDAAHAILPFYGQGANAGFEDCARLNEGMEMYGDDWLTIFSEYNKLRKPNTDAIADLCVEHYIQLRNLVGDPNFLLRKEIERKINLMYPDKYKDLYSMITFTCMPYTEALRIEREQAAIIDQIISLENIEARLNDPAVDRLIDDLMQARERRDIEMGRFDWKSEYFYSVR